MTGEGFGRIFRVTGFGESHGPGLGCVVEGCPAGLALDADKVAAELARRRPGSGPVASPRAEPDEPEILSGLFEGRTTGAPIAILVRNRDARSADYEALRGAARPGQGDAGWEARFGHRDHRGGGRLSGRETLARVAAGAVAKALLAELFPGLSILAWTSRAAGVPAAREGSPGFDATRIEADPLRCPDAAASALMLERITRLREAGDAAGGLVECRVLGAPAGLGSPVFGKLDAELARAALSIGGVKAFELGAGLAAADLLASEARADPEALAGGIMGGISTGAPIRFRIAVKPTPSAGGGTGGAAAAGAAAPARGGSGGPVAGRHDACLCPRIVPVLEAMTALVLADQALLARTARLG